MLWHPKCTLNVCVEQCVALADCLGSCSFPGARGCTIIGSDSTLLSFTLAAAWKRRSGEVERIMVFGSI